LSTAEAVQWFLTSDLQSKAACLEEGRKIGWIGKEVELNPHRLQWIGRAKRDTSMAAWMQQHLTEAGYFRRAWANAWNPSPCILWPSTSNQEFDIWNVGFSVGFHKACDFDRE
jgi:hypothetical protein